MIKINSTLGIVLLLAAGVCAAQKMKVENLPPAVKATVLEQSKGATIKGLAKEVEGGKTQYELELIISGKGKDMMIDDAGKILSIEEEMTLDGIPAGARDAIRKEAGKDKITKIEKVTEGAKVCYEAQIRKGLKTNAIYVNADGTKAK